MLSRTFSERRRIRDAVSRHGTSGAGEWLECPCRGRAQGLRFCTSTAILGGAACVETSGTSLQGSAAAGQVVSSVAWTSEESPNSLVSSFVHLGERVVPGPAPAGNGELHANRCVMPVLAGGSCGPTLLLPGAILLVSLASFDRPVSANDRVVQNHLPEEPSHHATCHDSRTCPAGVMAVTEHLHFQRPL